ncbi:MAG TPA: STAS domain-containing protein [Anaerolineaceae bacterium]|nr:STAS domain-containing protein [Anaerolineaceae bacterium]
MEFLISRRGETPGTYILQPVGVIDANSQARLLERLVELQYKGLSGLVIDLTSTSRISLGGFVALHSLGRVLRGLPPHRETEGWEVVQSIENDLSHGRREPVRLVNAQPKVAQALHRARFDELFEVRRGGCGW